MWLIPFILPILIPILLVPAIIGIYLLRKNATLSFQQMLGIFTLKPIVATPLWLSMIEIIANPTWRHPIPDFLVLAAPGIGITVLILWVYRTAVKEHVGAVLFILLLDSIRWRSSSAAVIVNRPYGSGILTLTSFVMPTIFAVITLMVAKASID